MKSSSRVKTLGKQVLVCAEQHGKHYQLRHTVLRVEKRSKLPESYVAALFTNILPITLSHFFLSVKKIKGAVRQRYGDGDVVVPL